MTSSLRQFCRHIQKYTFFSAIQYSVQETASGKCTWSVGGLFRNCLWWSSFYRLVNLHSFLQPLALEHLSPKWVICPLFPQTEQLPKLLCSRHIRNRLRVYLLLNSESQLGKSKEFSNQGLNVKGNLNAIFFFLSSKNNKKQTGSAWNY